MSDISETPKKFVEGVKQVPSKTTVFMVAGAVTGLLIGVMVSHALWANKPSLTPKIWAGVPVPPMSTGGL